MSGTVADWKRKATVLCSSSIRMQTRPPQSLNLGWSCIVLWPTHSRRDTKSKASKGSACSHLHSWHLCCGCHFTNKPGLAYWDMSRGEPPLLRDTQNSQLDDAWPGSAEMSWTWPGSTEPSSWAQPKLRLAESANLGWVFTHMRELT